jgi:hypothetical protein
LVSRVRPHAKVHTSLKYHHKTAGAVWPDNDMLAAYTRLLVYGIDQFAAKRGGVVRLNASQIQDVAGKKRLDRALLLLERLANVGLTSPATSGERPANVWAITIFKFAEKQGIDSKNCSPREQKQKQSTEEEKNPPYPPEGGKAGKPGSPASPTIPASFTPLKDEQYAKLVDSKATAIMQAKLRALPDPKLRHAVITPMVIRQWHRVIYPKLVSRKIQRQWQALSQNWWPRASPLDVKVALLKAREIEAAVRERRSAEQDTRPDLTPAQADEFYASLGATP